MDFSKFQIKPLSSLNGQPFKHILVVPVIRPGGGKQKAFDSGLPLRQFPMSTILKEAATKNPRLKEEMETRGKEGLLVSPGYVVGVTRAHLRENRVHTYGDGLLRQEPEIGNIPYFRVLGFRLVMIHAHVDPDICHERMIMRGREEEQNSTVRKNRLDEYDSKTLPTFRKVQDAGLADVFDLGDITQLPPEEFAGQVKSILKGYVSA